MGKKKLIELVTTSTEDKLDTNGALRNVAVSDAWKRLRQKIEVRAMSDAEKVLQELSDALQKINMLKSMAAHFTRLRTATPDKMVDEDELPKETPRVEDRSQALQLAGDLTKCHEEIIGLSGCLQAIRTQLEKTGNAPDKVTVPEGVSEDIKSCYQATIAICDKCNKGSREIEHLKKRIENNEKRNKDLEKQVDESEEKINKMITTVDLLEKKHANRKEEKMEEFKDQMKNKSLERTIEQKDAQIVKLKEENQDIKDRMKAIDEAKGSDLDDIHNPIPTTKVTSMYTSLFEKQWKEAFDFYKSSMNVEVAEAAKRLLQILGESYAHCEQSSSLQLQKVIKELTVVGGSEEDIQPLERSTLEEEDVKLLYRVRRQSSKLSCDSVKTSFVTRLEQASEERLSLQEITGCLGYIEQCVEVCWYMVLQSPPLYPEFTLPPGKPGTTMDKNIWNVFSGKGTQIDYAIWPPLFSSKGGSLLTKGHVQAK